jgi:hypothetical protein
MFILHSILKGYDLGVTATNLRGWARKVFGGGKCNFLLTKTLLAIVYRQ